VERQSATTLTAAARAKAGAQELTLPRDYHFSIDTLESLYGKPAHRVKYTSKRMPIAVEASELVGSPPKTPASPAPRSEPFSGNFIEEEEDDHSHAFDLSESPESSPVGRRNSAVVEPEKVKQIEIGYARKAKQVDIKQLKEDIKQLLHETPQADEAAKGKAAKGKAAKAVADDDVSFQGVVGRLHEKVSEEKLGEVSFAYCFICLLHLANEEGLEIADVEGNMEDMKVRLPPM
jgi:condensin complex subunit 2